MNQIRYRERELPYSVAEEMKTLRTNIVFSGENIRTVLVTSSTAGEGKSEISMELVRSFASLNKKTLLIDADLRKSVLKEKVEQGTITRGLTHYLAGHCKAEDILYSTQNRNVYVVPAGPVPPNPSELLSSSRFRALLDAVRSLFDYVVVDSPPLGMVIDAAVMAPHCDGAIIVIEAGHVSYRFVQEVKTKLEAADCKVLGAVLSKVDRKSASYYSYGKYYNKKYAEYYGNTDLTDKG